MNSLKCHNWYRPVALAGLQLGRDKVQFVLKACLFYVTHKLPMWHAVLVELEQSVLEQPG